jgi:microsomal dipeptidase-like Zn-dependent dipeptidase
MGLDYDFDPAELTMSTEARKQYIPDYLFPDGITMLPPESVGALAEGLQRRGWSDAELGGFLGGNLRRVAAVSWKTPAG